MENRHTAASPQSAQGIKCFEKPIIQAKQFSSASCVVEKEQVQVPDIGMAASGGGGDQDAAIERFKVQKLIASLQKARGSGTSMISLIMPPGTQVRRACFRADPAYRSACLFAFPDPENQPVVVR